MRRGDEAVGRNWISARGERFSGGGRWLLPRPGRIFAVSSAHTFAQLAIAIVEAFARRDRSRRYEFEFADGRRVCTPDEEEEVGGLLDGGKVNLTGLETASSSSALRLRRQLGTPVH